jgi:hypothetical protein
MALSLNVDSAIFAASLFDIIETVGVNLVTVKIWLKILTLFYTLKMEKY